jgi:hypothetical protein
MTAMASQKPTQTGGRNATTRHIPPKLALAVGLPSTPAPTHWQWSALIRALSVGSIPSLDVQDSVVATLNSLEEETERLESIYQRNLAKLDELKKSLLHQAFSGQLTQTVANEPSETVTS